MVLKGCLDGIMSVFGGCHEGGVMSVFGGCHECVWRVS